MNSLRLPVAALLALAGACSSPAPNPEPAPAPAPAQTKDAKGHDWASHMGDIPFTFDPAEAATRSKKERRVRMMYFTSPT